MSTRQQLLDEANFLLKRINNSNSENELHILMAEYYKLNKLIESCEEEFPRVIDVSSRTTGNVTAMMCPKCQKPATEYDANKWKCLDCQTKFIYEPPQEPLKPDIYVKNEVALSDVGLVYTCPVCANQFSVVGHPKRTCSECGKEVCPDCWFGTSPVRLISTGTEIITTFKKDMPGTEKLCFACVKKKDMPGTMAVQGIISIVWIIALIIVIFWFISIISLVK